LPSPRRNPVSRLEFILTSQSLTVDGRPTRNCRNPVSRLEFILTCPTGIKPARVPTSQSSISPGVYFDLEGVGIIVLVELLVVAIQYLAWSLF